MFQKPFVVLDLETSGIDPKTCSIIEVAAIRYENGKEVERLDAMVKIGKPLSKIITVITGITDEDLAKNGQPADAVMPKVEALIRGAYLVGHNVNFDAGFLKAAGIDFDVLGLIDTVPLAQVALPQAVSYSLESLADDLGISHTMKHRAMGDAEATLDLFKELFKRVDSLSKDLLAEIRKYLAHARWESGVVFEEAKGKAMENPGKVPGKIVENQWAAGRPPRALTVDEVFAENGVMAQSFERYEHRVQQVEMARHVMNAFHQGYHLICEAPTGVGKSLAYLTAAAHIAIANKSKVVISTNTINLQQQLYEKDIPLLQQLYRQGTRHPGVRTAVLKGRSHYLCLRRFAEFRRRPRFTDTEMLLLIKILVWQAITETGDSAEIHLTRPETLIWDFELCSDKRFCSPIKCRPYGQCYLHQAREMAEEADIIIVNHALLCADLEHEGLLPDYRYLVIDEAHHFEDAATQAFGLEITQENVALPIKAIQNHLQDFQRRHGGALSATRASFQMIGPVLDVVPDLQQRIDNFFSVVALFVNRNVPESAYVESLLVDATVLAMEDWMNLGDSMRQVRTCADDWLRQLKRLLDQLFLSESGGLPEQDAFTDELLQEIEILQEQMGYLWSFFDDEASTAHRQIRWMSSDLHGTVSLHMAPLLAGHQLQSRLYDKKTSVVLTSATLGVPNPEGHGETGENRHPFTYLRQMLSLDVRFEEVVLTSPFDFEAQSYVLLPTDVLPLTATRSMDQVSDFFAHLIQEVHGGLLGLFTSYASIETLYMHLMERPETKKTKLIGQRLSGGRNKVMKAYLNDPLHSALFGTASFWEGVDIQGEALTTLVIHRLPFDVPSAPVFKARQELFGNSFMEYSVPRAILRFKQGFGRLIRSRLDFGALIILDNRILEKDYGRLFLDALPGGITIEKAPLAAIPAKVGQWLHLQRG